MVMIPVVLILLIITMLQGTTIGGANASRWIRVPIVGFAFQPSTLAALVLMVYVARYLSKIKDKIITIKELYSSIVASSFYCFSFDSSS